MNKIYLCRHGQDEDNAAGILNGRRDMPLTELGRTQAKETAQKLKESGIEIVYASPLKRAYETARIIADTLKIDEVILDEHLVERDFGILTGKPIADIKKYSKSTLETDYGTTYFLDSSGGEDFPTVYERAHTFLKEVEKRHSNKNILMVCHGDIGKMICAIRSNLGWEDGLKKFHILNAGFVELSNL